MKCNNKKTYMSNVFLIAKVIVFFLCNEHKRTTKDQQGKMTCRFVSLTS